MTPASPRPGRRVRLAVPPTLVTALGCDAVGVPDRHGYRLMAQLPYVGCVFADTSRWWWIVPSGSNLGLVWPPTALYAVGACVPLARAASTAGAAGAAGAAGSPAVPRLIHGPRDATPYTPPIPLYLMICRVAGTAPAWSWDELRAA